MSSCCDNVIRQSKKKKVSGLACVCASHHGLHACPPLLLVLAPLHVLQVLPRFAERLQEGVEDPEELVRLHPSFVLPKVLQRFGKLRRQKKTNNMYVIFLYFDRN